MLNFVLMRIAFCRGVHVLSEESLGKITFRAFPKRVGLGILLLERVDYFGTSEHY